MSPEYGARTAALTARRLELPLRIAGAVPTAYRQYFEQQLRPLLQPGTVDYLGPLSRRELAEQAAHAIALLHPIGREADFDFGAVTAMAAGAPVVGFRAGALPEVVLHGETGFLVEESWQIPGAVDSVDLIDRRACRRRAQSLFDTGRMVGDHEALYVSLVAGERRALVPIHPELEALDPRPALELQSA